MKKTKVLIVDDHAIFRMGVSSLLGTQADIEVVGEADSGDAALEKARKLMPDVVLMDYLMSGMDGAEATRRLKEMMPAARIVILTTFGTADGIAHALEMGAQGAILKSIELIELPDVVRRTMAGERVLSDEIANILENEPPLPPLSPRQVEILNAITQGKASSEISAQLGISLDTVKEHTKLLFAKIGASNRAEAVAIALRKHLLKA